MLGRLWRHLGISGDAALSTVVAVAFGTIIGMLVAASFSCQPILCGTPEECAKCSWPGFLDTYDTLIATAFAIAGVAAAVAIGIRQEKATLTAMKEAGNNTTMQIKEAEREAQRNRGAKVIGRCYQMQHKIQLIISHMRLHQRYTANISEGEVGATGFYEDIPQMINDLDITGLLDALEVSEPEFFVSLIVLQNRYWKEYSNAVQKFRGHRIVAEELPPVFAVAYCKQMTALMEASDYIHSYISKYGGPHVTGHMIGPVESRPGAHY